MHRTTILIGNFIMTRFAVAIASLGGTISMTPPSAGAGVVPTLDAAQLAAAVPGLAAIADISAEALFQLPGASLTHQHLLSCLDWARTRVDSGARGVVITQGTDTLEETAFFLDLYWDRPEPLIVTGAMRTPGAASADGPGNLLAAVHTAIAPASRGRGVLVVMNDTIHAARWVSKTDAISVQAFVSPDAGPAGRMLEGSPCYFHRPPARTIVGGPCAPTPRVALVEALFSDDGELADLAVQAGYDAVVIGALGAGHVSFGLAERIGRLCKQVPVAVASRTGAGSTCARTYGFVGAEIDLAARGAMLAGWLSPRKTRLLLWALLAAATPRNELGEWLAKWSRLADLSIDTTVSL
jgi:L-asparaginase